MSTRGTVRGTLRDESGGDEEPLPANVVTVNGEPVTNGGEYVVHTP